MLNLEVVPGIVPLVGWRGFELIKPHFIHSGGQVILPKMVNEASCNGNKQHDLCPELNCSCGFYAFKTIEQLVDQGYSVKSILGEVWLYGRVIEHEKGFRAQYMYPKKLWLVNQSWSNKFYEPLLGYMGYLYGVELQLGDGPLLEARRESAVRLAKEKAERSLSKVQKAKETRLRNMLIEKKARKLGIWEEIKKQVG